MSQMQEHPQNTSGRQNAHYVTDLENTERSHIQNKTNDAVPQHFNPEGHKLTGVEIIPHELINSKRESIRKARESFYIGKARTMQPRGINREDDR